MLRSFILVITLCKLAITQELNIVNTTLSSSDTTKTWTTDSSTSTKRACIPSCQVRDIASDSITLLGPDCCKGTEGYTLKFRAISQEHKTKCNCGKHAEEKIDDCEWKLSRLCPNTEYLVHLEAPGSEKTNCTDPENDDEEVLKTKSAAPTKIIWENSQEVVEETAIELKWDAPICLNGDDVTYKVLYWAEEPNTTTERSKTNETQITLTNLSPKTTYNFQVIACNSMDKKLCSKSEIKEIRTKPRAPSEPLNFKAEVLSSSAIVLTCDPPEEPGGPKVDGYQIFYRQQGESTVHNMTVEGEDAATGHFEITDLKPGKTYLFTIRAYHRNEDDTKLFGVPSDEISKTTPPSAPSEPQNLLALIITSNQVALTWDEPIVKNGSINGYLVKWTSLTDGDGSSKENTTVDTTYTVKGLRPWTMYDFSVSAFNVHGEDRLLGPGAHLNCTTSPSEPNAPTNFTAFAINSSAIQLRWGRPDEPNGPIDRYNIVCWREGNETALENITLTPELDSKESMEHLVSDLQPWTDYRCLIWAVNMDGEVPLSGESSEATTRTKQDKPSPPVNLRITDRTSTEVSLSWEQPESPNGPLDGYKVFWSPSGDSSAAEESPVVNETSFTVSGLLPWREYSFSVSAFNNHHEDGKEPLEGSPLTVVNRTRASNPGGPPEELSITSIEARSAEVSWKAPKEPNGPINGYIVNLSCPFHEDCSRTNKTTQPVPETTWSFTNLEPYRTYIVEVCAYNLDEEDHQMEGDCDKISLNTSVDAPSAPPAFLCELGGATTQEVVWNVPEERNGPLDGYLLKWRKENDNTTTNDWASTNFTDLRPAPKKLVDNLDPYTRYQFRVSAFNLDETGAPLIGGSLDVTCRTEVAAPTMPTLKVRRVEATTVELAWESPKIWNGPLDGYLVMWKLTGCPPPDAGCILKMNLNSGKDSFVVNDLLPWSDYTFLLLAFNLDRSNNVIGSNKTIQETRTHAGVPEYPVKNLTSLEAVDTQIQFLFPKILFHERQGPIVRYAVVVAGLANLDNISLYHRRQGHESETMGTWSQSQNKRPMPTFQASPVSWNPYDNNTYDPFQCQDHVSEDNDLIGKKCIIGAERQCNATIPYCNGPLHSGNYYAVKIRGFTDGGWSETHPLEVFVEPGNEHSSSSTGVAVGVSLTIIFLLAGALLGAFFVKKKGLWPQKTTTTPTISSKPEDQNTPMTPIPPKRSEGGTCIPVSMFSNHVAVMLSDSGLQFSQEFEQLKAASPELPWLVANLPGNKPKNRWANILPFDHSRVKLRPISDDQETDYINASYIPGNSSRREYIASQGPLPSTTDDFWRMIWEQNVSMVVMLTLCVERGKAKCEQYWRDDWEPHYHGDDCIKVVKISESILSAYTIRIFDIQMGGHQRSVKHMHFTKWPDFGCPENPEILINFVRAVRDHLPHSRPAPILVHCSAGVGRTGTFVAVDRLMQQVRDKTEYLDVYRMVLEMRDHRCSMVQTEDQYIYIHECVREIIHDEQERTQTPVPNGFEIYSNLNFSQGE